MRMPMHNENKRKWIYATDLCLFALLLFADQMTKYLAIVHLKDRAPLVLVEGVFELQYLENRGSAFGFLQGRKVFLLAVGLLFMALLLYLLFRLPARKKFLPLHICLTAIVAGGLGNMIDRFRFDYVVDFFSFVLIHYPIFNVADCYIVVSTIALFLLFLFVYREEDLAFIRFSPGTIHDRKQKDSV